MIWPRRYCQKFIFLWAIPFIWKKHIEKKRIGYANALASSMMIAASFDLIYQGIFLKQGDRQHGNMLWWYLLLWHFTRAQRELLWGSRMVAEQHLVFWYWLWWHYKIFLNDWLLVCKWCQMVHLDEKRHCGVLGHPCHNPCLRLLLFILLIHLHRLSPRKLWMNRPRMDRSDRNSKYCFDDCVAGGDFVRGRRRKVLYLFSRFSCMNRGYCYK